MNASRYCVGRIAILDVRLVLRRRAASERDRGETVLLVEGAGLEVALKREQTQLQRRSVVRLAQQRPTYAAALEFAEHGELAYPRRFKCEQSHCSAAIVRDPDFAARNDVFAK